MPSDLAEGYDSVAMWTYLPLGCSPARVELINVHWFHARYDQQGRHSTHSEQRT